MNKNEKKRERFNADIESENHAYKLAMNKFLNDFENKKNKNQICSLIDIATRLVITTSYLVSIFYFKMKITSIER